MAGGAPALHRAFKPMSRLEVGRVAGDHIQGSFGQFFRRLAQVAQQRNELLFQTVFGYGAVHQFHSVGLYFQPVDFGGRFRAAQQQQRNDAAAAAQVAGQVPPAAMGKTGKHKSIGAEAVYPAGKNGHAAPQGIGANFGRRHRPSSFP